MAKSDGILRLLLVVDSLSDADNVINTIRSTGHAVRASRLDTMSSIEDALTNQTWDLVICRASLADVPSRELINLIHRLGRDLPCIILISSKDESDGLYDIGVQDIVAISDTQRLQFAVDRELQSLFNRRLARRNERALRESEKRSRLLLESSSDAIAYMHEGMHIYVNTAYLVLFGYDELEDISGLPMLDMITVDDHARFKTIFRQFSEQTDREPQSVNVQCVKSDGVGFKANIEFSHAEVEGENCTQVVIRDENAKIDSDAQLQLVREHDLPTGLYNRLKFVDELQNTAGKAGSGEADSALLYLVIDDFQSIKENLGLGQSEVVIKEVADSLRKVVVDTDFLARYSDQVFTIIVHSGDDNYVDERAEVYRKLIDEFVVDSNVGQVDLRCSIGISRISEKSSVVDTVLDNADKACVQAQRNGGNQVKRFNITSPAEGSIIAQHEDPQEWKTRLQDTLKNDDFCLHYQPIVSLHGKEQEIYEVLLRIPNEKGEILDAGQFIEQATHFEQMIEIDQWVISHALQTLAEHQKKHPKIKFFIKLSKQTLVDNDFIDWLKSLLKKQKLNANSLVFEISETQAMEDLKSSQKTVSNLKQVGCEFGLEHFGSGIEFSSILDSLDVDYLKINGAFVQNMAKDSENQAAVKAIIEMSKSADKLTIAEFVSDANSLALLWRLGVDYAQGYYIQRPSENLDYNFEDDDL